MAAAEKLAVDQGLLASHWAVVLDDATIPTKKRREAGYVPIRQTWVEPPEGPVESACAPMKRLARCTTSCCGREPAVSDGGTLDDAASEDTSSEVLSSTYGEGAHGADPGVPPGFIALGRDNPWLVCRSPQHNGKLFWMHRTTHETTWGQPLPRLEPVELSLSLEGLAALHPGMRHSCFAVVDSAFFGAPADELDPKARTGICGISPAKVQLRRTCETLAPEHRLYPR